MVECKDLKTQPRLASQCLPAEEAGSTMGNRWLSTDEIAAYLGIKRVTVYTRINDKQMPAHRMGRLWKSGRDEVDHWVKNGVAGEE